MTHKPTSDAALLNDKLNHFDMHPSHSPNLEERTILKWTPSTQGQSCPHSFFRPFKRPVAPDVLNVIFAYREDEHKEEKEPAYASKGEVQDSLGRVIVPTGEIVVTKFMKPEFWQPPMIYKMPTAYSPLAKKDMLIYPDENFITEPTQTAIYKWIMEATDFPAIERVANIIWQHSRQGPSPGLMAEVAQKQAILEEAAYGLSELMKHVKLEIYKIRGGHYKRAAELGKERKEAMKPPPVTCDVDRIWDDLKILLTKDNDNFGPLTVVVNKFIQQFQGAVKDAQNQMEDRSEKLRRRIEKVRQMNARENERVLRAVSELRFVASKVLAMTGLQGINAGRATRDYKLIVDSALYELKKAAGVATPIPIRFPYITVRYKMLKRARRVYRFTQRHITLAILSLLQRTLEELQKEQRRGQPSARSIRHRQLLGTFLREFDNRRQGNKQEILGESTDYGNIPTPTAIATLTERISETIERHTEIKERWLREITRALTSPHLPDVASFTLQEIGSRNKWTRWRIALRKGAEEAMRIDGSPIDTRIDGEVDKPVISAATLEVFWAFPDNYLIL